MRQQLFRSLVHMEIEDLQHSVVSEQFIVFIHCFRDAVRIDKQTVPGMQFKLMFPETGPFHAGNSHRMTIYIELVLTVLPADHRMLMSCIGCDSLPGGKVQDSQPDRDEKLGFVSFAKLFVDVLQDFRRTVSHHRTVLDQCLCDDHKQSRRDSFARNIGHHQSQMIIVDQEEIIKVASDLFRRDHRSKNIELFPIRESREDPREHVRLDLCRYIQLRPDPFFLSRDRCKIVQRIDDTALHGLDIVAKLGDLIIAIGAEGQDMRLFIVTVFSR